MSDILASVLTPPVLVILVLTAIILVGLWIVSVIWVNRDAKTREAPAMMWTLVAIVPVAGLVAYCLMRPPLNAADSTEQVMNLELMGRQLADYGNCPRCGEPVKSDFVACPNCRAQLRNVCGGCGRPLEPSWQICPYCGRPFTRQARQRSA
ncbi:MAG: zinc ribbon domain-containing protein [Coriobacteriales bacterium]